MLSCAKRTGLGYAALICGAALIASSARAEQFVPRIPVEGTVTDGIFYLSAGGTIRVFNLPSYNSSIGFGVSGSPVFETNPSVVTAGPIFTLGVVTPFIGLGTRPRFEVAFGALFGESRDESSTGFGLIRHPYSGFGNFFAASTNSLQTQISNFDAAFRFKTDFPLGEMVSVTPSIGVVGGRFKATYKLAMDIQQVALPLATNTFDDEVRTWSFGGEVGLDATVRLPAGWRVNLGVAGSMTHQDTRLRMNDCIVAPGCTLLQRSRTFNDRQLDFQVSGKAGVTYSWGWGQISLAGVATWNSDVPGVRRGTFANGGENVNGITYDDRFGYGGFVAIAIRLP